MTGTQDTPQPNQPSRKVWYRSFGFAMILVVVLVILVLGMIIGAYLDFRLTTTIDDSFNDLLRQSETSLNDGVRARKTALAALSFVDSNPDYAAALALMSYDLAPVKSGLAIDVIKQTLLKDVERMPFDSAERRFLNFIPGGPHALFFRINKVSIRKQPLQLELWNTDTGTLEKTVETELKNASRYTTPRSLVSPDGRFVLVEGEGQRGAIRVEVWDLTTWTRVGEPHDLGWIEGKPAKTEDSGIRNGAYWHFRPQDKKLTLMSFGESLQIQSIAGDFLDQFDPAVSLIPLTRLNRVALLSSGLLVDLDLTNGEKIRSIKLPLPLDDQGPENDLSHELVDCDDRNVALRLELHLSDKDEPDIAWCILDHRDGVLKWSERPRPFADIVDGPYLHASTKSFYLLRDVEKLRRQVVEKHDLTAHGSTSWTFQDTAETYGIDIAADGSVAIAGTEQLILLDPSGQVHQRFSNTLASDSRSLSAERLALFDSICSNRGSSWGPVDLPIRYREDGTPLPRTCQRVGRSIIVTHGNSGSFDLINLEDDSRRSFTGYDRLLVSPNHHPAFLLIAGGRTELWQSDPPAMTRSWESPALSRGTSVQIFDNGRLCLLRSNGTVQGMRRIVSLETGEVLDSFLVHQEAHVHPGLPLLVYRNPDGGVSVWNDGRGGSLTGDHRPNQRLLGVADVPPVILFLEETGPENALLHSLDLQGKILEPPLTVSTKELESLLDFDRQRLLSSPFARLRDLWSDVSDFGDAFSGLPHAYDPLFQCDGLEPAHYRPTGVSHIRLAGLGSVEFEARRNGALTDLKRIEIRGTSAVFCTLRGDNRPYRWPADILGYAKSRLKDYPDDLELMELDLISTNDLIKINSIWSEFDEKETLVRALQNDSSLTGQTALSAIKRAKSLDPTDRLFATAENHSRIALGIKDGCLVCGRRIRPDEMKRASRLVAYGLSKVTPQQPHLKLIRIEVANARLKWLAQDWAKILERKTRRIKAEVFQAPAGDSLSEELILLWYACHQKLGQSEAAAALRQEVSIYRPDVLPRLDTVHENPADKK